MKTTDDILKQFQKKYAMGEFRTIGNAVQQSRTIEIQNAHFRVDKPWIVREPNYEYYEREKAWYMTQSLNVNDIPGGAPLQWKNCATADGFINSNYGWCLFSKENGSQYESCKNKLLSDPHTREAVMILTRPSIQQDYCKDGMHDFICTQYVQFFINEKRGKQYLDCIVNIRSNDAVFGFNNDCMWFSDIQKMLANDLVIRMGKMFWNAGSLHVYERHFKFLENNNN